MISFSSFLPARFLIPFEFLPLGYATVWFIAVGHPVSRLMAERAEDFVFALVKISFDAKQPVRLFIRR